MGKPWSAEHLEKVFSGLEAERARLAESRSARNRALGANVMVVDDALYRLLRKMIAVAVAAAKLDPVDFEITGDGLNVKSGEWWVQEEKVATGLLDVMVTKYNVYRWVTSGGSHWQPPDCEPTPVLENAGMAEAATALALDMVRQNIELAMENAAYVRPPEVD